MSANADLIAAKAGGTLQVHCDQPVLADVGREASHPESVRGDGAPDCGWGYTKPYREAQNGNCPVWTGEGPFVGRRRRRADSTTESRDSPKTLTKAGE